MDNFTTSRLSLRCANDPVYVPGILGQKGNRAFLSAYIGEDWQNKLQPGDPNAAVPIVINAFSGKNMEAGKVGPAEWMAGLSVGHSFIAELRVRSKREMLTHPDTGAILVTQTGAQRYNVVQFFSIGSYFRYGRDGRKHEDEQIMSGVRHWAWDGKIPESAIHGYLQNIQTQEPQGGPQTQLLQRMLQDCVDGKAHELNRRTADRAPYVPGAPTFRNATVKQASQNAYPAPNAGFATQVQQAVNPVAAVQTGFTPPVQPNAPVQPFTQPAAGGHQVPQTPPVVQPFTQQAGVMDGEAY